MEKPINVIVVGQTGHGKSTFCNQLLGYDKFATGNSCRSITQQLQSGKIPNTNITIYDLPGFADPKLKSEEFLLRSKALSNKQIQVTFVLLNSQIDRVQNDTVLGIRLIQDYLKGLNSENIIPVFSKVQNFNDQTFNKQDDYIEELWSQCKLETPKEMILFNQKLEFNQDPVDLIKDLSYSKPAVMPDYQQRKERTGFVDRICNSLEKVVSFVLDLFDMPIRKFFSFFI